VVKLGRVRTWKRNVYIRGGKGGSGREKQNSIPLHEGIKKRLKNGKDRHLDWRKEVTQRWNEKFSQEKQVKLVKLKMHWP